MHCRILTQVRVVVREAGIVRAEAPAVARLIALQRLFAIQFQQRTNRAVDLALTPVVVGADLPVAVQV
jgi:hypothetical protein